MTLIFNARSQKILPSTKLKFSNDHECKATIFFKGNTLIGIITVNLQPSLGTDSGVAVTIIEAFADMSVALPLLEPNLVHFSDFYGYVHKGLKYRSEYR